MVYSMDQISSEIPPSSKQCRAPFAPLVQDFTMKHMYKLTQYHVVNNEKIGKDQFYCKCFDFARFFEGNNIVPTVISCQRYSLESNKSTIKWILSPDNIVDF